MKDKYVFVVITTKGEVETAMCNTFTEALKALSSWHGKDGEDPPHQSYSITPVKVLT